MAGATGTSSTDVAPGISTKKRDALNDALGRLDRREADVLISTHLDRMSRSVIDFAGLVERAKNEAGGSWSSTSTST